SSANLAGVSRLSDECGRSVLYSRLHDSICTLAAASEVNQWRFRQSSRKVPLKLSTKQFCTGLPGCMKSILTPRAYAQAANARLVSSVAVSVTVTPGGPGPARGRARD